MGIERRALRANSLYVAMAFAFVLPSLAAQRAAPRLILLPERTAPDDLEVTGLLSQSPGFVSYRQLAALPQTTFTLTGEADLSAKPRLKLRLSGVPLDALAKALGVGPQADLLEASCTDRYRAHFPAAYVALHRPVLVVKIDDLPLATWAARGNERDPGPYLVAQQGFTPSFRILGYAEQLQFPTNVVQLRYGRATETFSRIAPSIAYEAGSPVERGFRIAREECLRCHFQGASGGTKSGISWQMLATWAREQPAFFSAYIRNPQASEARAHMPAHPTYDPPTLAALTAYFQTFAPVKSAKAHR